MADVSKLFREEQSNTQYKSDAADGETTRDDQLNLRNEIQDPWMPFSQVYEKEKDKLLDYPKQKKESQF